MFIFVSCTIADITFILIFLFCFVFFVVVADTSASGVSATSNSSSSSSTTTTASSAAMRRASSAYGSATALLNASTSNNNNNNSNLVNPLAGSSSSDKLAAMGNDVGSRSGSEKTSSAGVAAASVGEKRVPTAVTRKPSMIPAGAANQNAKDFFSSLMSDKK